MVGQKKTGRPVKFELTDQTRQAVDDYLRASGKKSGEFLFTSRRRTDCCMTTRQYARLVAEWINTDLNPLEAMVCYKQLWTVEQTFRTAKHLFSTRPIFHKLDETIRGHVFCSFLALVLKSELEERIAGLGRSGSWPEIIADLDSLTETEIEQDGKRFVVRSAPRPAASLAVRATGVVLPPTVHQAAHA